MSQKWAFNSGEHHDEEEDKLLTRIDVSRRKVTETMATQFKLTQKCARCGNVRDVSQVRGELVCLDCREKMLARHMPPDAPEEDAPVVTASKRKRGGPYLVVLPDDDAAPLKVYTNTAREARDVVCRKLGRKRLPKGTRVFPAP